MSTMAPAQGRPNKAPIEFINYSKIIQGFDYTECYYCKNSERGFLFCTRQGSETKACYLNDNCSIKQMLQLKYESNIDTIEWRDFWYTPILYGKHAGKSIKQIFDEDLKYVGTYLLKTDYFYGDQFEALKILSRHIYNAYMSEQNKFLLSTVPCEDKVKDVFDWEI